MRFGTVIYENCTGDWGIRSVSGRLLDSTEELLSFFFFFFFFFVVVLWHGSQLQVYTVLLNINDSQNQ